jgi:phosphoglycerate dehydrogenase-like enzyme
MASTLVYGVEVMDRARRLLVIARTGIGYDKVDVGAATDRGIAVCNTPEAPTVSTAEHALALILAAAKGLERAAAALRAGEGDYYNRHRATELEGKTLGLVGFGRIARRLARMAAALGMEVVAYDPLIEDDQFFVRRAGTLDDLMAESHVVSLHVPLTPGTRHLIDASRLANLRPGSILVNTARGEVVDQDALLAALDSGRLAAAGLDVTEPEPLPPSHPLLSHPAVVVTPHVASATEEGRTRIFRTALDQAVKVLQGRRPEHLVNPEVWTHLEQRRARLGA